MKELHSTTKDALFRIPAWLQGEGNFSRPADTEQISAVHVPFSVKTRRNMLPDGILGICFQKQIHNSQKPVLAQSVVVVDDGYDESAGG